jgi:hypothetical protein
MRRPLSSRESQPESPEPEREREGLEAVVFEMLLQGHAATRASVTVFDVLGRLVSVGLIVYFGLVAEFTVPQLVSGVLVAALTSVLWVWRRHRLIAGALSVEETLSRMAGGAAERAYIESRFISEVRRGPGLGALRAEPAVWLVANLLVITVGVIVSGVSA